MTKESTLIIGLHGSLSNPPADGVHDAAYCIADLEQKSVMSLVESEKITGIRHDGCLNKNLLNAELSFFEKKPKEFIGTHFTTFNRNKSREFPFFKEVDKLDHTNLQFTNRQNLSLLGNSYFYYTYLHELAHVFTSFMFRPRDHQRFLGLVIEGCGSFSQNSLYLIDGFRIELLGFNFPILSGNFFHQWLSHLVFNTGRKDYSGRAAVPGKAMALAAYGDAQRFRKQILESVSCYHPGQYMNYRNLFCQKIEKMQLSWKDRVDLCASGQALFEDLIVKMAVDIRDKYGDLPLYYAGGCALSVKANSRLREIFNELVIAPNCADDGIALGLTALHAFSNYQVRLHPLIPGSGLMSKARKDICIKGRLSLLDTRKVAEWLAHGEVVAYINGTPEIGPRALGRRSILASPTSVEMRQILNHIKEREYYRPTAPVVLDPVGKEIFIDYFFSPYMLYNREVQPAMKEKIPSAVHIDGTSRIQSISAHEPGIADILRSYADITGNPPVLLNTSLNTRGRAIAACKEQILKELNRLKIKHAVLGGKAVVNA
jgi:carbamoyltransferase